MKTEITEGWATSSMSFHNVVNVITGDRELNVADKVVKVRDITIISDADGQMTETKITLFEKDLK